jgi:hypothetical protein
MVVASRGGIAEVAVTALVAPNAGRVSIQAGGRMIGRLDLQARHRALRTFVVAVPPRVGGTVVATVTTNDRRVVIDSMGVVKRPPRR